MRVLEVGVAAGGEGADQVQRRGRLPIRLELAVRIGDARFRREGDVVDDVAAVARQLDAVLHLGVGRARLGELAGDAPDLHHRQRAGEGEYHRHLQEDAEEIADVIGRVLGEALGAIAALEQERLARRDAGQRLLELARLAREDQRREAGQLRLDGGELRGVRIGRGLLDRLLPPARGGPSVVHRRLHFRPEKPKPRRGLYTPVRVLANRPAAPRPAAVQPTRPPRGGCARPDGPW